MTKLLTALTLTFTLGSLTAAESAGSSISAAMQEIAQQELDKGVQQYNARGGCMLVLEAATGDILAQAQSGDTLTVNTPFEPCALFIPVTVAAGLELTFKPETPVDINTLVLEDGTTIKSLYPHRAMPVWCAITKSLDAATARIALQTTAFHFCLFISKFGFSEGLGNVNPVKRLAMVSQGKEIHFTPLQMAAFYAAVANGGIVATPDTTPGAGSEPVRGMETETASAIMEAMEAAVTGQRKFDGINVRGTANKATVPGVRIACKTGTTKIRRTNHYHYEYITSAVSIFPVEAPKLVVLTVIDNPRPKHINPGGGTVAAPILSDTVKRLLPEIGITPATDTQNAK